MLCTIAFMLILYYSLTVLPEVSDLIGFSFRIKGCLGELSGSKRTRQGPRRADAGAPAGGVLAGALRLFRLLRVGFAAPVSTVNSRRDTYNRH